MTEQEKLKRSYEILELIYMNKYEISDVLRYEIFKLFNYEPPIDYDDLINKKRANPDG